MGRIAATALAIAVLLTGCGSGTDDVVRAEDGERAVRRAVVDVVPDLLAAASVPVDDDTALRGGYRPCGAEGGRVQYVAEQAFAAAPGDADVLGPVAHVLARAGWTTSAPHSGIVTASVRRNGEAVRTAVSLVGPRIRLRVEAACSEVGGDVTRRLVARGEGVVPP